LLFFWFIELPKLPVSSKVHRQRTAAISNKIATLHARQRRSSYDRDALAQQECALSRQARTAVLPDLQPPLDPLAICAGALAIH
jgi:hypothetical protein